MIESAAPVLASAQLASEVESPSLQAGYGMSLTDLTAFEQSLASAGGRMEMQQAVSEPSEAARAVFKPLEYINNEAAEISDFAKMAAASGNEMTPGEMITLTVRSHEFMFHCQLTSNIANRTSDGLQQLFRQQS